jgi:hypothetical protein
VNNESSTANATSWGSLHAILGKRASWRIGNNCVVMWELRMICRVLRSVVRYGSNPLLGLSPIPHSPFLQHWTLQPPTPSSSRMDSAGPGTLLMSLHNSQALRKVWVNIFDLLDAVKAGTHPEHFKSQSALRHHTIKYRKIYPKKEVKKDKGNPAAALLAHIFA